VVYGLKPHRLEELKTNIEAAVAKISVALLHKVSENMIKKSMFLYS
jgi:hypothetical protein